MGNIQLLKNPQQIPGLLQFNSQHLESSGIYLRNDLFYNPTVTVFIGADNMVPDPS
jgi:hypothetical protein